MGIVRRGSSARVASCLPRSMAALRTAPGILERCAARGAAAAPGGLRARVEALRRAAESTDVRRTTRGAAGRGVPRAGTCALAREAPAVTGVTCDTGVSSLAAPEVSACVVAHAWLREGKQCYGATNTCYGDTHDGDTARCCLAGALCHGAHGACVLAVACACGPSRAWMRVSQRADPGPPADSSRFGRAAPSSGAT